MVQAGPGPHHFFIAKAGKGKLNTCQTLDLGRPLAGILIRCPGTMIVTTNIDSSVADEIMDE